MEESVTPNGNQSTAETWPEPTFRLKLVSVAVIFTGIVIADCGLLLFLSFSKNATNSS